MAEPATSESGDAVPPTITYSRAFILSLYQSPLVPAKPHGMRDLAEWFGEFDPPMSPHRQHQTQPTSHNTTSTGASEGNSSSRAERAARPNPFNTTFGHFGVDGGLTSSNATGAISITAGKEGKRGQNSRDNAPHLHGGSIEKDKSNTRDKERDWENRRGGGDGGAGTSPPNTFSDGRERTTRRGGDVTVNARESTGVNGRERREEKKEGRAEEGGWRTAGDRDRRLRPTQTNSHSNSYSDQQPRTNNFDSREQRNDRSNKKSNQPAWMDDDANAGSASATPSWMDAPATGGVPSFGGKERETSGADGGAAPVDSIQAWKQQMKEMEKKERERNVPASVEPSKQETSAQHVESSSAPSVSSPPVANGPYTDFGIFTAASTERPSVFENSLPQTSAQEGGGESRARSRFAKKFFNSGEAPPQPPAQKAEPVRANEASREDLESMNRLMGMLQGSGTRTTNEPAPPRINYATSPLPAPTALPVEATRPRQSSASGSRFSFSQSPQPPPTRQDHLQLSQQQQQFFAAQAAPSQQAFMQPQQYPPQDPHRPGLPHSRSSSKNNAPQGSPPLSNQYQFSSNGYSPQQGPTRAQLPPLPPGVTRLPEYTNPPLLPALNAQQQQHYQQQGLVPMGPNSSRPPPQLSPMYAQHSGNFGQAPPPLGMGPRSPFLAPSQQQQQITGRPLPSPNGFAPPMGYAPQHFPQQQQFSQRMPPTGPGGYPYQAGQPQQGGGGMFGPQVDLMALLNAGGMRNS